MVLSFELSVRAEGRGSSTLCEKDVEEKGFNSREIEDRGINGVTEKLQ